jgi:hypothetical protein
MTDDLGGKLVNGRLVLRRQGGPGAETIGVGR